MAQHRKKRTTRSALAVTAFAATVGMMQMPATAEPGHPSKPENASDAVKQYKQLAGKAEKVHESYLKAKSDLQDREGELRKAKTDAKRAADKQKAAHHQEEQFRGKVDRLSQSTYQGARLSKLSVMMTGESPHDFLDRASALKVISTEDNDALQRLAGATKRAKHAKHDATGAQRRAQNAKNAAAQLTEDIKDKGKSVQRQISDVKDALDDLDSDARSALDGGGDDGTYVPGGGPGGKAMKAALGQRGVPYVWGGESPSGFDCSGLIVWAFKQAGVSMPHSAAAQQNKGKSVPRSQLKPGDLVFFGSPAHHVGIYLGNGKMVDSPDFGQSVKVESLQSDYSGARRIS